jgi:hypothetical protein
MILGGPSRDGPAQDRVGAREGRGRVVSMRCVFRGFRGCVGSGSLASLRSLISGSTQVSGGRMRQGPHGENSLPPRGVPVGLPGGAGAGSGVGSLGHGAVPRAVLPSRVNSVARRLGGLHGQGANGLVSRCWSEGDAGWSRR